MPIEPQSFLVEEGQDGTILSVLRQQSGGESWSTVRRLMRTCRVAINGVVCLDEGRRLTVGEQVTIAEHPLPPPPKDEDVKVRFADDSLVVVEKPSGMIALRRRSELGWSHQRRLLHPTLDEAVPRLMARHASERSSRQGGRVRRPRLYAVHRIDRDTSGLMVFARSEESQATLIEQFAAHTALRSYLAIVPGQVDDQTIATRLVRDRGDGLRGSTSKLHGGRRAVTHINQLRPIGKYCELRCRLETGRTNQIRIHLAELGHPVCGDIKYRGPYGAPPVPDESGCPRLALHAAELGFEHPFDGRTLNFTSPWPDAMRRFLQKLPR